MPLQPAEAPSKYVLDYTFLIFNNQVYEDAGPTFGISSPRRGRVSIRYDGEKITVLDQCSFPASEGSTGISATDVECQLLSDSLLADLGVQKRIYERFELSSEKKTSTQVFSTEFSEDWNTLPSRSTLDALVASEEERTQVDVVDFGAVGVLNYDDGSFSTFDLRTIGDGKDCGTVRRSGTSANGRIRELGDDRYFLEGFSCLTTTQAEPLPDGGLVECERSSVVPSDLPSLWIRQFQIDHDRLVLDGEMRRDGYRYCVSLEAPLERSDTVTF